MNAPRGPLPDRKITEILREKRFTFSAEIVPPRNGASPASILSQIQRLTESGTDFLAVTKGAGGSLRGGSLPIAQMIKDQFGVPCIAHFTCRDLLPEEVENHLVDHHFLGIRNILALRGDPPMGVVDWQPRPGSYPYASQLVTQIRELNRGQYLERKGFSAAAREPMDFCVGVACYPDHAEPKERIEFFRQKVTAGAEFAITQMLFSAESYARFIDDTVRAGLNIPVLPGTRILRSKEQALKMAKRFAIEISESQLRRLPETDVSAAKNPNAALDAFLSFAEDLRRFGSPGLHIFVLTDTELSCDALKILSRPSN